MNIRISRAALDAIVSLAAEMPDEEVCGLLLGHRASPGGQADGQIDTFLPAANVAADRARRFEIDPATLIRAHRAERAGGARILGCYHSHPGGNPTPSAEDATQAETNGGLWLICAGPPWRAKLWTAVTDGQVQRRFDPVALTISDTVDDMGKESDNPGP